MLFEKERHVSLESTEWDEEVVLTVINDIISNTVKQYSVDNLWTLKRNTEKVGPVRKSIYFGAAGTLWGLIDVASALKIDIPLNFVDIANNIYNHYMSSPDTEEVVPSYFLGESGVLLLKLKLDYKKSDADKLFTIVLNNIQNPTLETLWGAPGTTLAAFHAFEIDNDERWVSLIKENSSFLIKTLKSFLSKGDTIWQQDLYGRQTYYVGAGHGYFGNIYPLLKCLNFLDEKDQSFVVNNVAETTKLLAIEKDGKVNWPATLSKEKQKSPLVQWCHGAPGILNCLIDYPKNIDLKLEELLEKAGELIWSAGPLEKGSGLCHGTDGNGIAFLQLYKRTGNKIWLDRARSFAMHAIDHKENNFSLFTGDIGLAVYLKNCLKEVDRFPTLDVF